MNLQLNDKTALVTGGTAGIGLEIARSLAAEGANVLVTGRNQAKLDAAIADIGGANAVRGILADAAASDGAAAIVEAVGEVDILVNNLGIYESKAFGDITDANWLAMFETNVLSGVRLSRAFFPGMLARNWGRVIFVSSESGLMTPPDMIHYATSKTAQLAIARGLAQLAKGKNVTVNSVLPGPTRSDGIEAFLRSQASDPKASIAEIEAEFFAKARPTSIIQRMSEPQEVASLVTYLASPLASATTGAALRVEGGLVPTLA